MKTIKGLSRPIPTVFNPSHGHPPELIDVLVGELFIMFVQTDCGVVLAQTDCAAAYSYGLAAGELPAGARMPPNLKEQRI